MYIDLISGKEPSDLEYKPALANWDAWNNKLLVAGSTVVLNKKVHLTNKQKILPGLSSFPLGLSLSQLDIVREIQWF